MRSNLKMKDPGKLQFLRVKVYRKGDHVTLLQQKYTLDLLSKIDTCKLIAISSVLNQKLGANDENLCSNPTQCQIIIGAP